MKTAYFDCFSGISGDMTVGALIDAGLDFKAFAAEMDKLALPGFSLSKKKVKRSGLAGTKFTVKVEPGQPQRNLADIEKLIGKSKLSQNAKDLSVKIFGRLAKAEAKAHGAPVERVHFHEVGAVDSIIDIVGAAVALDMMGIEKVISSPLNLGSGIIKFSHGAFPVPAPATAELVRGFPAYGSEIKAELTTPTGAAIITTVADSFSAMPAMKAASVGYGAGDREVPEVPNLLRVFIGETSSTYEEDVVNVIEANIDDMDPRVYEYVMERLFEAGALDVWLTPIIMKKSRPATKLSVMADAAVTPACIDIVMYETTTFGVRITEARRRKLAREFEETTTGGEKVSVKAGRAGGKLMKKVPEYEDAKAAARKTGRPLRELLK